MGSWVKSRGGNRGADRRVKMNSVPKVVFYLLYCFFSRSLSVSCECVPRCVRLRVCVCWGCPAIPQEFFSELNEAEEIIEWSRCHLHGNENMMPHNKFPAEGRELSELTNSTLSGCKVPRASECWLELQFRLIKGYSWFTVNAVFLNNVKKNDL